MRENSPLENIEFGMPSTRYKQLVTNFLKIWIFFFIFTKAMR